MQQLYQDAMAIVRHYGKPDLFITFTCNPKWKEITEALHTIQTEQGPIAVETAGDRPDLCVRVFRPKLKALLRDLLKKDVLGKVIAYTWVIEFQKRGLPHAHILLVLRDEDKLRTPEEIDHIVSAEIPDRTTHPKARETVLRAMLHRPCGIENPKAPCMEERGGIKKCSKHYPRHYVAETTTGNDGYPNYRRRNRDPEHSDQWVVPHNLWLTTKYDAHINVEVCSSISAVKYLFKYVYKGHDKASVAVGGDDENEIDEIKDFVDARYISACESLWRIFGFPMHAHSPNIYRMPVHLEGAQQVSFHPDDDLLEVIERNNDSRLMAFFKLNAQDPEARAYLFSDIPKHYSWDPKRRSWKKRKNPTNTIGRIYFVHPKDGERYCLRLLLLNIRGPTSFESFRIAPGGNVPLSTYREAALAHQLLEDDQEWHRCLHDVALHASAHSLRHLFAMVLCHCAPSNPADLWETFAKQLSDDFLYSAQQYRPIRPDQDPQDYIQACQNHAQKRALYEVNEVLKEVGSSLAAFGLLQDFKDVLDYY